MKAVNLTNQKIWPIKSFYRQTNRWAHIWHILAQLSKPLLGSLVGYFSNILGYRTWTVGYTQLAKRYPTCKEIPNLDHFIPRNTQFMPIRKHGRTDGQTDRPKTICPRSINVGGGGCGIKILIKSSNIFKVFAEKGYTFAIK